MENAWKAQQRQREHCSGESVALKGYPGKNHAVGKVGLWRVCSGSEVEKYPPARNEGGGCR